MSGSRLLFCKCKYIFNIISSTTVPTKNSARYINSCILQKQFRCLDFRSNVKFTRKSSSDSKTNQNEETEDGQQMTHEEKEKFARDTLSLSLKERFKVFTDEDSDVILDADEISRLEQFETVDEPEFSVYSDDKDEFAGCNLEHGKTGVFDIEDLVNVLREEKAKDICVISVPPELHYADYLVFASAFSPRHSAAMSEFLRKLHKRKKHQHDPYIDIVGRKTCADWKSMDFGNIVLHIFLPEKRAQYDLESLWTVGRDYDELTLQKSAVDTILDQIQSNAYSYDVETVTKRETD